MSGCSTHGTDADDRCLHSVPQALRTNDSGVVIIKHTFRDIGIRPDCVCWDICRPYQAVIIVELQLSRSLVRANVPRDGRASLGASTTYSRGLPRFGRRSPRQFPRSLAVPRQQQHNAGRLGFCANSACRSKLARPIPLSLQIEPELLPFLKSEFLLVAGRNLAVLPSA
jgi:hypothetical protein